MSKASEWAKHWAKYQHQQQPRFQIDGSSWRYEVDATGSLQCIHETYLVGYLTNSKDILALRDWLTETFDEPPPTDPRLDDAAAEQIRANERERLAVRLERLADEYEAVLPAEPLRVEAARLRSEGQP